MHSQPRIFIDIPTWHGAMSTYIYFKGQNTSYMFPSFVFHDYSFLRQNAFLNKSQYRALSISKASVQRCAYWPIVAVYVSSRSCIKKIFFREAGNMESM